jgi:NodT family efflux transporter outer membrane factor (OMF) lipoprotein
LPQAPAQVAFINSSADVFTGSEPASTWWQLFDDPALDAIVKEALAANTDLRVAAANLARAEAVLREFRNERLPSTTVNADVTKSRQNFFLDEPIAVENTVYNASIGASYQLDFFGRVKRAIEASQANTEATEAALHVAQITVAAQTAAAYAEACAYGAQLRVAENNLALQSRSLELTVQLLDAGRGTSLDVSSASTAVAQSRAIVPSLQAQRDAALYRLAVLMGRVPGNYPAEAADCSAPLTLAEQIPIGDGAALLQRRPDLRQAERELAAATAQVGLVMAEFYPTVSISG